MRGGGVLTPFAEEALRAAHSIVALGKRGRAQSSSESLAAAELEGEDDDDDEEREEARVVTSREEDSVDTRKCQHKLRLLLLMIRDFLAIAETAGARSPVWGPEEEEGRAWQNFDAAM